MKIVSYVSILIFVAGCATGPKHENYIGYDAACIKGKLAGYFKWFDGEANVYLNEIDSKRTDGIIGPFCVSSGIHKIKVHIENNYTVYSGDIEINLEEKRQYQLKAYLVSDSFDFKLVDITAGSEFVVSEFSRKANGESKPFILPITVKL